MQRQIGTRRQRKFQYLGDQDLIHLVLRAVEQPQLLISLRGVQAKRMVAVEEGLPDLVRIPVPLRIGYQPLSVDMVGGMILVDLLFVCVTTSFTYEGLMKFSTLLIPYGYYY